MISRILRALARLFYPRGASCIACGALRTDDGEGRLCRACLERLEEPALDRCPGCGTRGWALLCPKCAAHAKAGFTPAFAPWDYRGTARALILALKYHCVAEAALPLAEGMAAVLPCGMDALVPVPLHSGRLRERGFNQARLLCDAIGERTDVPVLEALARVRYTKTQTKLSGQQRDKNVRGAFVCRGEVRGLRLALVDDVRTTGATAENCARVLREAGAAEVILLTAAVATQEQHAADG